MADIVLYHAIKIKHHAALLPLGLMALSSCLKQAGYSVKVVDAGKEENTEDEALKHAKDALFFGITTKTGSSIHIALSMAKKVRENTEVPIVWGGPHVSLLPDQTIANPYVDVVVRGQGEEAAVELANAFRDKLPLKDIQGITFKENGNMISTPDRPLRDINKFPMLDYEAVDVKKYVEDSGGVQYLTSRGCPFRCKFCSIKSFYGRAYLRYAPQRVVDEVELLVQRFGEKRIGFMDDNFFVDKHRVLEICRLLKERNLDIKWNTMCRCDYFARFDDDFLRTIKDAGCNSIIFGGESGSPEVLKSIQKDITIQDILASGEKCKKLGIHAWFSFVTGFPHETVNDLYQTIDIMDKLRATDQSVEIQLFSFVPLPKTELLEESVLLGLKRPETLEDWGEFRFQEHINPWLSGKHKQMIKELNFLIDFLFMSEERKRTRFSGWQKVAYALLLKDAQLRWKLRLFGAPYEWLAVRRYASKFYTNK